MVRISQRSLARQIARLGRRWGIVPMWVDGRVLAAEQFTALLSGPGINYSVKVDRDITAISPEYPFSALLRSRLKRGERTAYARRELKVMAEEKARKARFDDEFHELAADIRRKDKLIVPVATWERM